MSDKRSVFESYVDGILENPKTTLEGSTKFLIGVGIEPTIDTILSYITGLIFGIVSQQEFTVGETAENIKNLYLPLLERRAWEIRQAFIKEMNR